MNQQKQAFSRPLPAGFDAPLSLAVRKGPILALSGQIPVHPVTGELVGTAFAEQLTQVLDNVSSALALAGATLGDVVSMRVYLRDMTYFAEMNEIYARLVPSPYPARTTLIAPLPLGMLVEVEALAVVGMDQE